jgi:hypothetical protein
MVKETAHNKGRANVVELTAIGYVIIFVPTVLVLVTGANVSHLIRGVIPKVVVIMICM